MIYYYFVSFAHGSTEGGYYGHGNMETVRGQPITTMEHVRAMRDGLIEKGIENPVILNYILLRKEEAE